MSSSRRISAETMMTYMFMFQRVNEVMGTQNLFVYMDRTQSRHHNWWLLQWRCPWTPVVHYYQVSRYTMKTNILSYIKLIWSVIRRLVNIKNTANLLKTKQNFRKKQRPKFNCLDTYKRQFWMELREIMIARSFKSKIVLLHLNLQISIRFYH